MGQFRLPFSAANLEPDRPFVGRENRYFMPVDTFATPERRGLLGVTNPQTQPWHLLVVPGGPHPRLLELDGNGLPQPALTWPTEPPRPWYQVGDIILIENLPEAVLREEFPSESGASASGEVTVGFRLCGLSLRTASIQLVVLDPATGPQDLESPRDVTLTQLEEQFREVRRFARQRPG